MKPALFLDFDGVLCDSVDECFVVSWLAFHRPDSVGESSAGTELSQSVASVPPASRRLFASYRPFIRRGPDYMLLQYCIHRGIELRTQEDFDEQVRRAGSERMNAYNREFYRVRASLLAGARGYWISLNRPYDGVDRALRPLGACGNVHVVSTKEVAYIAEIFASWGVAFPPERLHFSGGERKGPLVARVMARTSAESGVLIDDQIDHFSDLPAGLTGKLAVWGYVKPEWLERIGVDRIDLPEFRALLATYAKDGPG